MLGLYVGYCRGAGGNCVQCGRHISSGTHISNVKVTYTSVSGHFINLAIMCGVSVADWCVCGLLCTVMWGQYVDHSSDAVRQVCTMGQAYLFRDIIQ